MARQRRVAILGGGRLAYGALGMVRPSAKAGDLVVVGWSRSAEGQALLKAGGAVVKDSAADAVSGADIVLVCVPAPSLADLATLAPLFEAEQDSRLRLGIAQLAAEFAL